MHNVPKAEVGLVVRLGMSGSSAWSRRSVHYLGFYCSRAISYTGLQKSGSEQCRCSQVLPLIVTLGKRLTSCS